MERTAADAAKVSVIIPVYKTEPYLRQCLDSVLNQTYRDLEILLIDDGSPDLCGEIRRRFFFGPEDGHVKAAPLQIGPYGFKRHFIHLVFINYRKLPTRISIPIPIRITPPRIPALPASFVPTLRPMKIPARQIRKVSAPMISEARSASDSG